VILSIICWSQRLDRLSVRKRGVQKFDNERFNLKKLNDVGVKYFKYVDDDDDDDDDNDDDDDKMKP